MDGSRSLNKFRRRAFIHTVKLDRLVAAAPSMGFSVSPAQTKQPAVITKTVMKPMLKAVDIGIEEAETTDPKTGEIKSRIVLTQKAQQFLLDNLDRILEEK